MKTDDDYIRERAELAGLTLSDSNVTAICEKWMSDPSCSLDDLIKGIRMLRDNSPCNCLTELC